MIFWRSRFARANINCGEVWNRRVEQACSYTRTPIFRQAVRHNASQKAFKSLRRRGYSVYCAPSNGVEGDPPPPLQIFGPRFEESPY